MIESVDIFRGQDDEYSGVKVIGALTISVCCLVFPASALRWDGSVRSVTAPAPANVRQLSGNASLNRGIRFISTLLIALPLSAYASMLCIRELQKEPLRRKAREAKSILEDEYLNAKILEVLPEEPASEPERPKLPPAMMAIVKEAMKAKKAKQESVVTAEEEAPENLTEEEKEMREIWATKQKQNAEAVGAPTPNTAKPDFSKFRTIGEAIINSMVVSDKSVMIASGTGTGKTTTEREYLRRLIEKYPQVEIHALLNKGDSLPGVTPERRQLFDPNLLTLASTAPEEEEESPYRLEDALAPLYHVYHVFSERRHLPEEQRKHLKETAPIRVLLGDWFYTYQELQARLSKKNFQLVISMLRGIITVGRDSGVGAIVDTQSAALEALGLANDQSIRQSLDIYGQGFIYYEDGEVKGELETIRNLFSLNGVCSPENRKVIAEDYKLLAGAIERQELNTPIIFTTVGARPRLGVVPNLEPNKNTVANQENVSTIPVAA